MTFGGKVAVVTGGSSGIGKGCAIRLAKGGADVVIIGRQLGALEQAREDILAQTNKTVMTVQCDVSDASALSAMAEKVLAEKGRIDILVNNAGFSLLKPLLETTENEWDDLQAINLKGAWLCTKAFVPNMVQRGEGGRVIMISSASAQHSIAGRGAFAAAKGGLNALTRTFAIELARHGITVNGVAPGPIESEATAKILSDDSRRKWGQVLHVKRMGRAEEVAEAVAFLASDLSGFVTGHIIPVDGGFSAGVDLGDVLPPE